VVGTLTTLWIQTHIKSELGIAALGLYVASNTIAMQYAGLVLTAMAGDFFPRLSGVIADRAAAARLVNQQTEVALLLAGPLILGMFALAPWVMQLLYSEAFAPAAAVLRWQAAGTLLKVVTWPMGFILLAQGAGRAFFMAEVSTVLVMAAATALAVEHFGLAGTGIGYLASYVFYLPVMLLFSAPRVGLVWSAGVIRTLALVTAGLGVLLWPAIAPSFLSNAIGLAAASAISARLAMRAARMLDLANLFQRFRGTKQ
jgi:PST family polysaccharide transporter